jgi:putative acetyltransferase
VQESFAINWKNRQLLVNVLIHPEADGDQAVIREVNRRAFAQEDEARLVDRLRAGGYVRLSLVAALDGQIVGHILFSELPIICDSGATVPSLALAPMGVLPEFQRRGIGAGLVREGLERCAAAGHGSVVVLGHPEYYPRFGFSAALAAPLRPPFDVPPEAWMALELTPGALNGVRGRVVYPPPFGEVT